jgi:cysteine-S-conjugate beta-lyase
MSPSARFDAATVDDLRRQGSLKWTLFPEAIGAFIAEMDFGLAPPVAQALHDAVDRGLVGYLPPGLAAQMSRAYADWAARHHGWSVPPERVRPLSDVLAGLEAAVTHFSRPRSPVILPTPAYMPFLRLPAALGRDLIEVPMALAGGRYTYDLDALDAAFRAGGNLLVLCNPHNPIGRVLDPAELAAVAEVVERHGGRVFSDEIHAPLVMPGHRHTPYASISPATAAHTVTATSASKAWNLPGLKCAQLVLSDDADAEHWARVGQLAEHGASTLGVVANIAAYTAGDPWLEEVVGHVDTNRRRLADALAAGLPDVGYVPPEGTYLAWLDVRALELGDRPADFFLERAGVALTDGSECGRAGAGFVRLTLATPGPVLDEIVDRMARAVAGR